MTKREILGKIKEIFSKVDKLPDNSEVTEIHKELSSLYVELQQDVWKSAEKVTVRKCRDCGDTINHDYATCFMCYTAGWND